MGRKRSCLAVAELENSPLVVFNNGDTDISFLSLFDRVKKSNVAIEPRERNLVNYKNVHLEGVQGNKNKFGSHPSFEMILHF